MLNYDAPCCKTNGSFAAASLTASSASSWAVY